MLPTIFREKADCIPRRHDAKESKSINKRVNALIGTLFYQPIAHTQAL